MKKNYLLLAALVAFGFTNAQVKQKNTVEITPKIGFSGFAESTKNDQTNSNSGTSIGATVDYYFNNRWSFRSGLIADKMGGTYSSYEDKINYVSVPVNANWHFGSTRKWNLNFGVSPSFLTSASTNGADISSALEKFQLGFTYGIGYKIEITPKFGVLIDSQFFDGLTNISVDKNFNFTNHGYSFNVGGVIQL